MDTKPAVLWIASHRDSYLGQANEQDYYRRVTLDTAWIEALVALGRVVLAALHVRTAGRAAVTHDFASSH